ncbi:hypothetical protein E4U42_007835 [Claviceps africana]|uniref:Uncharacterized protein n=1 Tax=Claviceps africana TaxID=83212 RepID=A0A8K0JB85_9HYPO|nr:hypothetical protein E4U42_007835 [Claviceps africana]
MSPPPRAQNRPSAEPTHRHRNRRLGAAPVLLWSLLVMPSLANLGRLAPLVQQWRAASLYSHHGVTVPLARTFYGVRWLDELLADVVASFGLVQFHDQSRHYWHSLDFLAQYGALYAILLLEASRAGWRSRLLPGTVAALTLAQLASGGVVLPVLFFFFILHTGTRPHGLRGEHPPAPSATSALAVLPTVLLVFYVPHLAAFLSPDLRARHWWNWLWQPFPVWGAALHSVLHGALQGLVPSLPARRTRVRWYTRLQAARLTAVCVALLTTGTYWYAVGASGSSWWRLYVPSQVLAPAEQPEAVMGTFLQFDCLSIFGSALTWLAWQLADLKAARVMTMSWTRVVALGAVCGVLCGPGTLCCVGWMAREELLAAAAAAAAAAGEEERIEGRKKS